MIRIATKEIMRLLRTRTLAVKIVNNKFVQYVAHQAKDRSGNFFVVR